MRWLGGQPADVALVHGARAVTYAELDERADRVAAGLVAAGCAPGDRLLALLPSGVETYELLLGCVRAGLVLVPLNWRLTADELSAIARDANAAALVTDAVFGPPVAAALLAETSGRLHVRTGPSGSYEDWLAHQRPEPPMAPQGSDRVVLQVYTSGTSGTPKGVLLTAGNFETKVPQAARAWGLRPGAVSLLATPLFHVGGLGWGLAGLHTGATTLIAGSAAPTDLIVTLRADRVTHTFLVPTMIERVCALAGDQRFPDLEAIVYGAAPIDPGTRRAATDTFECRLLHVYGLTETTGAITQLDSTTVDPAAPRAASAGRPYPWVEISVRDPAGNPVGPGEPGEVWTRSGQNTPGYHRDPAATAELVGPDGWLRTGDGGHLDEDGYLFLTHRIKELIISGGENVHPTEVEDVLRGLPGVAEVAVVGLPDRQWGEVVTAVVVPRAGRQLTPADVIAYAEGRLAGYKRPRAVRIVDKLPRTATGKLRRREIVDDLTRTEG
jgi:long-chain acyl-CoA synthetase